MTMSLFANVTSHNQGTHCIRAFNLLPVGSAYLVNSPNAVMFDLFGLCDQDDPIGIGSQSGSRLVTVNANSNSQSVLNLLQ